MRQHRTTPLRRIRPAANTTDEQPEPPTDNPERDDLRVLEARIEHLEALVQGLQDCVHRESTRRDKRIATLEARIQPEALGKALSEDARARGL